MRILKEKQIWMLWRRKERNGSTSKEPFSANGGPTGTSPEYGNTWVTYEEARSAAKRYQNAGIGFKIPDGVFFLDIDHKDMNDPVVQDILSTFNSYTEYSVSGDGIHVYGLCDFSKLPTYADPKSGKVKLSKDFYMHHPSNGLELYVGELTNRYAAYTGNVIVDQPLLDCTDALVSFLNRFMRRTQAKPVKPESEKGKSPAIKKGPKSIIENNNGNTKDNPRITDDLVDKTIAKLRRRSNGDKFSRLFDDGEMDRCTDHSTKDIALCFQIAFCTSDEALIDAVFRRSALYREDKWEREDYRDETIAKAIEACCKWKSKIPPFVKVDDKGYQSVSAPLLAKHIRENMFYIQVRDRGNQAALRYVYENGVYVLYDLNMLYGKIKQYITDYNEELVKMSVVKETAQLLLSDLDYVSQDELNSDESIINFQNGLLKVTPDSLELMPHSPNVYSTIQIPCCWCDEPILTPIFDSYLSTLTNGDEALANLLLEYMGCSISNIQGWRLKKALFLVGDGNTGKSQLKSLAERLLGKGNYIGIDLSEVEARFGTGAIYGSRLAGSSDMSFLSVDELKAFKKITGGDSLFAEFKGQQPFEYVYKGLLWFCMNKLPKFSGDMGQWVYDRIMVVNCPNVIPREKQDKQLLDKMYAEREGIVQKCVQAVQQVIASGYRFSEPDSVSVARSRYQAVNSTVISFADECLCPWPDDKINDSRCSTGTIYKVYVAWCKDNNNGFSKSAREFREELASHENKSFQEMVTRRNGNTFYKDFTLTEDAQRDYGHLLK